MARHGTIRHGRHKCWALLAKDSLKRGELILAKYEIAVPVELVERTAVVDARLSGRQAVSIIGPANLNWKRRHERYLVMRYSADEIQLRIDLMAACNV